jgi:hypothetical protein
MDPNCQVSQILLLRDAASNASNKNGCLVVGMVILVKPLKAVIH